MIGKGYEVTVDLYDIAKRLREIDEDYFVFYSYKKKRYEVHNRSQRGNTLAFTVPYNELDTRTLSFARRTRRERAEKLMREMERENEILRRNEVYMASKKAQSRAEESLKLRSGG